MAKRPRAFASHAMSPWFPLYYILVVGGGITLLGWHVPDLLSSPWGLVLLWTALILVTDVAPVSLPGGGYITASSTLDYAGILILGPVPTAAAEFVATLILQLGVQRRPLHRALFNAFGFAGTVIVAGWVFQTLGGVSGRPLPFPESLLPLAGMGVTYHALNTGLVSFALALSEGRKAWHVWQVNYVWTVLHMLASLPLGLALAVVHQQLGLWGIVLFILPLLLARSTFKLYLDTKRDLIDFARVLAGVIDEFDPYTHLHSHRVSRYAVQIARELGLSEHALEQVEYSGLLHDIGKISVSQRDLVAKPGPLTMSEYVRVCQHADIGADILEEVRAFRRISPIVRYHHERIDGRGYHKLPGKEVPQAARIVMVADAFDAMTSDRVYRTALPLEEALAELKRNAGTQFDAQVVDALNRLLLRGEIQPRCESTPSEPESMQQPDLAGAGLV